MCEKKITCEKMPSSYLTFSFCFHMLKIVNIACKITYECLYITWSNFSSHVKIEGHMWIPWLIQVPDFCCLFLCLYVFEFLRQTKQVHWESSAHHLNTSANQIHVTASVNSLSWSFQKCIGCIVLCKSCPVFRMSSNVSLWRVLRCILARSWAVCSVTCI